MEKLLLAAVALICQPGDRLIDLSGKLPRGLQYMDLIVSVEPFYTRVYNLPTWIPRQLAAVLRQQTHIGFARTNRNRSILRQAKPATDEMEHAGNTSPRH